MKVRAKFECINAADGSDQKTYTFDVVRSDCEENKVWSRYTPSGSLFLGVKNPEIEFTVGKRYYLDIEEAG